MSKEIRRKVTDDVLANDEKLNKLADRIYEIFKKANVTLDEFSMINRKVKKVVKDNVRIQ